MRHVDQLTATNKLLELKELKSEFDHMQEQIKQLSFMGRLSE